jgi:hypothetical protein
MRRFAALLFLFSLFGLCIFAQGLNTTASKDDWEEINFEFNSSVLTDGYPSLLRLADLLHQHPDYRVKIEGHADRVGSNRYNDRLGQRRADQVKAFLVKYGAADGQMTTASFGKRQPKVSNGNKEGRFMNRRVTLTVTDATGKVISAGGIGEAISAIDKDFMAAQKKCCDDILKRLDRLDEIADMLRKMQGENESLRSQLKQVQDQQSALDQYVRAQPKPLTSSETASIVDTRTAEQIERARMPRFSLLGVNAGLDQDRNLTFTGKGRFFAPFKEQFAFQAQGEYMYFKDRKEGEIDFGLVDRFLPRAQFGVFNSFKHVNLNAMQSGATLGQASATLDYIFGNGRVGVFGAKGYMNGGAINRTPLMLTVQGPQGSFTTASTTTFTETYLATIDQVGVSTLFGLIGNSYLEGNVGYLKSRGNADRPGGTLRFVFPMSDRWAFTLEGGMNETMVGPSNNGRVVAGFQFGNFMRPRDYMAGYNGIQHAVPVDIPRVRWEMLTRRVTTGNSPPIADAGPDQLGVPAGTITLNGSGSYSPAGRPISCQWVQIAGAGVTINNPLNCTATFTAAEGSQYSFRLLVRDDLGQQSIARTSVSTTTGQAPQIIRFETSPRSVRPGEGATLTWQVLNATSVTITPGIGSVGRNGNYAIRPDRTTEYTLTASNEFGTVSAVTNLVVDTGGVATANPAFSTCTVSPSNVLAGESATITYATSNAASVSLQPGVGSVPSAGQQVVTPTQTTTYTLTAAGIAPAVGPAPAPVTCQVTVSVTAGPAPRIVTFTASPATIDQGKSSTLTWNVENATTVTISGLGTVAASGSQAVSPTTTTTYTITATNSNGQVTGTQTVTVNPGPGPGNPVAITGCTATPSTVTVANTPVSIAYTATNATAVTIPGVQNVTLTGPVTVTPTQTTTYTITAAGANNTSANCTVTVTVNIPPPPAPPTAIIAGPSSITTLSRFLTLDASPSTNPGGGALTYQWEAFGTGAAILDQGQPVTRVQLGGLFGDYIFRVTVKNAAGQSDSTTVTIHFQNINPH